MLICRSSIRQRQSGLSVVELMVGIAIGLFIVAATTLTVTNQLFENRRLLLETQIQQDLRAAADIVTRELRRAGAWDQAISGMWTSATQAQKNPFSTVTAAPGEVAYRYRRGGGTDIQYGFKLENHTIKSIIVGSSGFQELTDPRVLKVTAMSITPVSAESTPLPCPKLCPQNLTLDPADERKYCWPTLVVRELEVDITAEAANDPTINRSLRTTVRLRNDWVRFNDVANPASQCPQ